jgi:hypothetical protein
MIEKRAFLDDDFVVIAVLDININETIEGQVPTNYRKDIIVTEERGEVVVGMKWNQLTNKFE